MKQNGTKRLTISYLALTAALLALFMLNIFCGSTALSPKDILSTLFGAGNNALAQKIIFDLRLPRAAMVVLLGAALSVAGYLLQTFFANPIAGPFVMGVSGGAKLAVALTMVVLLNMNSNPSANNRKITPISAQVCILAVSITDGV